jgi:hypothetical protein
MQAYHQVACTAAPADYSELRSALTFCRVMLVGLGGNNGTSVMAGILANKQ